MQDMLNKDRHITSEANSRSQFKNYVRHVHMSAFYNPKIFSQLWPEKDILATTLSGEHMAENGDECAPIRLLIFVHATRVCY